MRAIDNSSGPMANTTEVKSVVGLEYGSENAFSLWLDTAYEKRVSLYPAIDKFELLGAVRFVHFLLYFSFTLVRIDFLAYVF